MANVKFSSRLWSTTAAHSVNYIYNHYSPQHKLRIHDRHLATFNVFRVTFTRREKYAAGENSSYHDVQNLHTNKSQITFYRYFMKGRYLHKYLRSDHYDQKAVGRLITTKQGWADDHYLHPIICDNGGNASAAGMSIRGH